MLTSLISSVLVLLFRVLYCSCPETVFFYFSLVSGLWSLSLYCVRIVPGSEDFIVDMRDLGQDRQG